MAKARYQNLINKLLKDFSEREKEVIARRFGFGGKEKEPLEAIGRDFGITRERVRQIQESVLAKIGAKKKEFKGLLEECKKILKKEGGFKKEDVLFEKLDGKEKNEAIFLVTASKEFIKSRANERFFAFWALNDKYLNLAFEIAEKAYQVFQETKKPLSLKELRNYFGVRQQTLRSALEISRLILKNDEELYGLKEWPEINPRTIKDRAYLVFKKIQTPLHFSRVAELIGKDCLPQTVHNELIKDPRFVLVGRGIYALKEWGYIEGEVKDVIAKVLKESGRPLTKEEIVEKVLEQRMVKKATVLLNLCNKNYFKRDSEGKYFLKGVQEA